MNKIAAEFAAALPEPRRILGLRLLPLSLGRYYLLKRFDSPFVDENPRDVPLAELNKELFFALLICGFPVAEFKELLTNPKKLKKEAHRFGKIASKIIENAKGFHIIEPITAFKNYLDEATKLPWHPLPKESGSSESSSHWSHGMEVTLCSRAGWTEERINETPLGKAQVDFFKLMEMEGAVDLISHEDYAMLQKTGDDNAKAMAEFLAAQAKGAI